MTDTIIPANAALATRLISLPLRAMKALAVIPTEPIAHMPDCTVSVPAAKLLMASTPLPTPTFSDALEQVARDHDCDVLLIRGDAHPETIDAVTVDIALRFGGDALAVTDLLLFRHDDTGLWLVPSVRGPCVELTAKGLRDHFEEVVAAALRMIMPGWDVYETGWSKIAADGKRGIVQRIAEWTKGKFQDETVFPSANDAQVDVAVVKRFRDDRSAIPVLLGQCATGVTDWKSKAARPNIERWCKAVQFSSTPVRLFAVPFALDDESFREASVESNGLILDRIRICGALTDIDASLDAKLTAWLDQARPMIPLAA